MNDAGGKDTGPDDAGPDDATIDVAAVDDHPIILDSIAGWISGPDRGIRIIATAATVDDLLAGPGRHAQVVLLDLDLGDETTAERNVAAIRARRPRGAGPGRLRYACLGPGRDTGGRARLCT